MKRDRWALLSRKVIGRQDNPMLIRWRLIQTPWFGIYLHFIHREDLDRLPHDHPWVFRSIVLRGGYEEEFYPDVRIIFREQYLPNPTYQQARSFCSPWLRRRRGAVGWQRRSRSTHTFPVTAAHRIVRVQKHTTTLVLVGRKWRTWGFYDGGGNFIDWRDYHGIAQNAERQGVMA